MTALSAAQRRQVSSLFAEHLLAPVQVVFFSATEHDRAAAAMRELLADLAALSDGRIRVSARSGREARAEADAFGVKQAPALVLLDGAGRDTRIRFYGVPMGVDLVVLLEDLIDVSRGETRLSPPARELVRAVDRDLTVHVYSTPT